MAPSPAAPRVAVVIPTFNRLHDLEACLTGVRAQTRAPDLVIVLDNMSTDGTRRALATMDDVVALLPERNLGAPGGFEAGMQEAFGRDADWVWLLDDDAVPEPAALERMLERAATGGQRLGGVVPTVGVRRRAPGDGLALGIAIRARPRPVPKPARPGRPSARRPRRLGAVCGAHARPGGMQGGRRNRQRLRALARRRRVLPAHPGGWLPPGRRALAVVRHPAMPTVSRRLLGRDVTVGRIAPWREYYDTRNRRLLSRALEGTSFATRPGRLERAREELLRAVAVAIADPAWARRLWMRALGAFDGARGNLARRPELEGSADAVPR